ncbi:MAG: TIGR00341 family protein [Methylophilaceae bacterium]|nr:TIGR00341 family protein [Methylophilaceae bacterium]
MNRFTFARMLNTIRHVFSLSDDISEADAIDTEIRSNVSLRGTNLWVLMLAILIASVGLDVNSTAVVIGAMLISPLMGPIMGIGYGIGVYDFPLIRKAVMSLLVATLIAFLTSTLYFLISPLSEAHSELLARTSPTIWDVLIAFFGGLAGMIAATRKIKTNVIPGVAIATALMPPLCTAGYGLANGQWNFFFGAFYLYIINSVFIAFAAVIIISAMKLPHRNYVDAKTESRVKKYLSAMVLITVVPSFYLAYHLVKEEVFTQKAKSFVAQEFKFDETYYSNLQINPKSKTIELSLIGKPIPKTTLKTIQNKLIKNELEATSLVVHQAGEQQIDTLSLKTSIVADLYKESQIAIDSRDQQIAKLNNQLRSYKTTEELMESVTPELHTLFPEINSIVIANGIGSTSRYDIYHQKVTLLLVNSKKKLSDQDSERLIAWLGERLKTQKIKLIYE